MHKSKVSIIMATFNRAHLIAETLESVRLQTYCNWECIIVDDGSSDNSQNIIKSFIDYDKRFKYYFRSTNHKKGISGSRNQGLELATGEYIIFFDDDDIVHPKNLETCLYFLQKSGSDFCHYKKQAFTDSLPILNDVNTQDIGEYYINSIEKVVTQQIALASCTVLWKRKCFSNIRFDESLTYAEEWECYARILLEGCKGTGIDGVLYYNRKHPASNTGEFWLGDEGRKASQIKAIKLVAKNLKQRNLLSGRLIRHFVQMAIFLKEKSIVEYVLQISDANIYVRTKYRILFKFYPIIVTGHRTKKLLKKKLS